MSTQVTVVGVSGFQGYPDSSGVYFGQQVTDLVNSEQYGLVDDFIGWEAVTTPYFVNTGNGGVEVSITIHLTYKKTT
ncbi:TPA: hypothetical protein ACP41M_004794 [Klebsiella aerogenes]